MTFVVATVLVFNNAGGLQEVLRCLSKQTRRPDAIVVLDNGSLPAVDSSISAESAALHLIRFESNSGVGAGHNAAIREALRLGAEAVWLLEHDTYPDPSCLSELLAERDRHARPTVIVTELTRNNYERQWLSGDTENEGKVARFTLNGPLIDSEVFSILGGLNESFFVGQEDWDYSNRARTANVSIVRCVHAVAVHPNKGDGRFGVAASPTRLYYSSRNLIHSAGRTSAARQVVLAARVIASSVAALGTPGKGHAYAAARLWAYLDALAGKMGRQHHRFQDR
jgi:GT2 family glycosyltransferase